MPPIVPGIVGWGTDTRAAYGDSIDPTIYRVTRLDDNFSSPVIGSLRYALQAAGPRIVIFEISGYINLRQDIFITNPYLTVAGQTAPSPGITIRHFGLYNETHDVLLQHFRIRTGAYDINGALVCSSGLFSYGSSTQRYNQVYDHLSVSWGQDENFAFHNGARDINVTVWRCITSEGLHRTPGTGGCSGGGLSEAHGIHVDAETKKISIIQTIFASNAQRNPYFKGGNDALLLNNLIYQWYGPWGFFFNNTDINSSPGSGPWHITAIGNRFIPGPYSTDSGTTSGAEMFVYSGEGGSPAGNQIYRYDNTFALTSVQTTEQSSGLWYDPNVSAPPSEAPIPSGYTPMASTAVEVFLRANAGARPLDRDAVDARIVNEIDARSGRLNVEYPSDVGGYPTLAENVRALTTPGSPHSYTGSYTNMELWLQQYAAALEPSSGTAVPGIDPATGAVVVQDTFTGSAGTAIASHTGEVGATWTSPATGWVLTDANALRGNTANTSTFSYASGIPATADYDVDVDWVVKTPITQHYIGIFLRSATSFGNGVEFTYDPDVGHWKIQEWVSSVQTVLDSTPASLTAGLTYRVSCRARDDVYALYVNDELLCAAVSGTYTATGRIALSGYFTSAAPTNSTGTHLGGVTVTDAVPVGGTLHYIETTDNPDTIFAGGAAGDTYVFRTGLHRYAGTGIEPRAGDTYMGEAGAVIAGAKVLSSWTHVAAGGGSATIARAANSDGFHNGGFTDKLEWLHTTTGEANTDLYVAVEGDLTLDNISAVTYNGLALTLVNKVQGYRWLYLYHLSNPPVGTFTILVQATAIQYLLGSAQPYYGVNQTGQPYTTSTHTGTGTSATSTLTSLTAGSHMILLEGATYDATYPTAGTGANLRTQDTAFGTYGLFDSNGAITPTSHAMTTIRTNSVNWAHVYAAFAPAAAASPETWYATGQTSALHDGSAYAYCATGFGRCDYPEELFINDVRQTHVTTLGAVGPGTWYFDYAADRIYIGTNPSGKTVETSIAPIMIVCMGGVIDGVTVSALTFEKFANLTDTGVVDGRNGSNWLIENCVFRLNHASGATLGLNGHCYTSNFHHNGQGSVGGYDADGVWIEGNESAYNGQLYSPTWSGSGMKVAFLSNLMIRDNYVHDNYGPGIWCDIDCIDVVIEENRCLDNSHAGIFYEISFDAVIRNNVVERNGLAVLEGPAQAAIFISESANVEIHHNQLLDNKWDIIAYQNVLTHGSTSANYGPRLWALQDVYVHHNHSDSDQGLTGLIQEDSDNTYYTGRNNRFVANTYRKPTTAATLFYWNNASNAFAAWQSTYLQDVAGSLSTDDGGTTTTARHISYYSQSSHMPFLLRYATAGQEVPLGQFVDSADAVTPESALNIANTDIRLWRNGGTTEGAKNSGGAFHIATGRYYTVLDATDTNTLGPMLISVAVAGALPRERMCWVLPINVYDSWCSTDLQQVDAREHGGVTQTGRDIGQSVLLSPGTGTGQVALSSGAVPVTGAFTNDMHVDIRNQLSIFFTQDTYAEPGVGAPPATATIFDKISYLYKFMRNRVSSNKTTGAVTVYNDDGSTAAHKAIASDDNTTYVRGEFGAP